VVLALRHLDLEIVAVLVAVLEMVLGHQILEVLEIHQQHRHHKEIMVAPMPLMLVVAGVEHLG
jgi:hypothetical protein